MSEGNPMDRIYGPDQQEWSGNKTFEQPSGIWGRGPMLDYLKEHIIKDGDVVVDLGSGGGGPTAKVAEMVGEKGRVIGLELSKSQLGLGKDQTPLSEEYEDVKNLNFINASITEIPLETQSVDKVVSFMVLHDLDISSIEDALKEVARILKSDGEAVILTMHPELFDSEEWDVPFWNYDNNEIVEYKQSEDKEGFRIHGEIKGVDGKGKRVEVLTHTKENFLKAIENSNLKIVDEKNMYIDEQTAKEKYGDVPMRIPTKPAYWLITLKKA